MVGAIYELKNQLLESMLREVQERGGIDRLDKERVDMVKDLAEAEKNCWEAEYYRSVAEAMEGQSGYGPQMGYDGMYGAQQGSRGGSMRSTPQSGSQRGYRDSMGRYARRGYGYQEHIDALKAEMQNADPQQREAMMQELRGIM